MAARVSTQQTLVHKGSKGYALHMVTGCIDTTLSYNKQAAALNVKGVLLVPSTMAVLLKVTPRSLTPALLALPMAKVSPTNKLVIDLVLSISSPKVQPHI
jgi:hypothetical protein